MKMTRPIKPWLRILLSVVGVILVVWVITFIVHDTRAHAAQVDLQRQLVEVEHRKNATTQQVQDLKLRIMQAKLGQRDPLWFAKQYYAR